MEYYVLMSNVLYYFVAFIIGVLAYSAVLNCLKYYAGKKTYAMIERRFKRVNDFSEKIFLNAQLNMISKRTRRHLNMSIFSIYLLCLIIGIMKYATA